MSRDQARAEAAVLRLIPALAVAGRALAALTASEIRNLPLDEREGARDLLPVATDIARRFVAACDVLASVELARDGDAVDQAESQLTPSGEGDVDERDAPLLGVGDVLQHAEGGGLGVLAGPDLERSGDSGDVQVGRAHETPPSVSSPAAATAGVSVGTVGAGTDTTGEVSFGPTVDGAASPDADSVLLSAPGDATTGVLWGLYYALYHAPVRWWNTTDLPGPVLRAYAEVQGLLGGPVVDTKSALARAVRPAGSTPWVEDVLRCVASRECRSVLVTADGSQTWLAGFETLAAAALKNTDPSPRKLRRAKGRESVEFDNGSTVYFGPLLEGRSYDEIVVLDASRPLADYTPYLRAARRVTAVPDSNGGRSA